MFHKRRQQYYHLRLGLPLTKAEFLNPDLIKESDDWEINANNRILEEYDDVCYEEKELMKMWNDHVNLFPPYSNRYASLILKW